MSSSDPDHEPLSNSPIQRRGTHLYLNLDAIVGNGPQEILNYVADLVESKQLVESVFVKGGGYLEAVRGHLQQPDDVALSVFEALSSLTSMITRFEVAGDSRFGGLFLPVRAMTIILRLNPPGQLASLRLGNVILTCRNSTDIQALAQSIRLLPSLTSIDLVRCRSEALEGGGEGGGVVTSLQPILEAISAMNTLQQAMLCETIISPTATGFYLGELCKSRSIQKLWWKTMPDTSDEDIKNMVDQLINTAGAPTMLRELTIRSHGLGKRTGEAIADLLRQNTTLRVVNLDLDQGQDGVVLADALKDNDVLQCLDVWAWNGEENSQKITNAFTDMLCHNTSIKFLTFQGLDWNNPLVDFYLGLNRAGRQLLLRNTGNRKLWTETLIRHKDDLSLSFYFLIHHPSILSSCSGCTCTSRLADGITKKHEQSNKNTNTRPAPPTKTTLQATSKRRRKEARSTLE